MTDATNTNEPTAEQLAAEKEAKKQAVADERARKAEEKAAAKEAKLKEAEAKRAEANAKKEAEREEKKAQKAAEREAKNKEAEAARAAEADVKKAAREQAREQSAAARKEAAEAKKAQKLVDQQAAKDQRDAEKAQKAADKKAAAESKKEQRKADAEARAALIAQRKEANKPETGRRPKATHIVYVGEGLSSPQALSIRGKVLQYIKDHCPVGEAVSIDDLGEACKPLLYGSNIRSYLSKLEEMGHLNFVVEAAPPEGGIPNDGTQPETVTTAE